jgi:hypothetical protein
LIKTPLGLRLSGLTVTPAGPDFNLTQQSLYFQRIPVYKNHGNYFTTSESYSTVFPNKACLNGFKNQAGRNAQSTLRLPGQEDGRVEVWQMEL